MPNWCNNNLTLSHSDPQRVADAVAAFEAGKLLEFLLPPPTSEWDYYWCLDNWGTKWDVGGSGCSVELVDPNTAIFSFDSAWSPPTTAYSRIVEDGWTVDASYCEPGMAFCGRVTTEDGTIYDDYYEYGDQSADTVRDYIGEELDDQWGISDMLSDLEEMESDMDSEYDQDQDQDNSK